MATTKMAIKAQQYSTIVTPCGEHLHAMTLPALNYIIMWMCTDNYDIIINNAKEDLSRIISTGRSAEHYNSFHLLYSVSRYANGSSHEIQLYNVHLIYIS